MVHLMLNRIPTLSQLFLKCLTRNLYLSIARRSRHFKRVMTIIVSVNGNNSGEGFLIAPRETKIFRAPLGLRTDDGTSVNTTLQVASGGANIEFEQRNITVTEIEKFTNIHATSASSVRNDTVLEIL